MALGTWTAPGREPVPQAPAPLWGGSCQAAWGVLAHVLVGPCPGLPQQADLWGLAPAWRLLGLPGRALVLLGDTVVVAEVAAEAMAKVEGAVPQRRTKRVRAPAPAVEVVKTHFSDEESPASAHPRARVAVAGGAKEAAQATPRVWEPSAVPHEAVLLK